MSSTKKTPSTSKHTPDMELQEPENTQRKQIISKIPLQIFHGDAMWKPSPDSTPAASDKLVMTTAKVQGVTLAPLTDLEKKTSKSMKPHV